MYWSVYNNKTANTQKREEHNRVRGKEPIFQDASNKNYTKRPDVHHNDRDVTERRKQDEPVNKRAGEHRGSRFYKPIAKRRTLGKPRKYNYKQANTGIIRDQQNSEPINNRKKYRINKFPEEKPFNTDTKRVSAGQRKVNNGTLKKTPQNQNNNSVNRPDIERRRQAQQQRKENAKANSPYNKPNGRVVGSDGRTYYDNSRYDRPVVSDTVKMNGKTMTRSEMNNIDRQISKRNELKESEQSKQKPNMNKNSTVHRETEKKRRDNK